MISWYHMIYCIMGNHGQSNILKKIEEVFQTYDMTIHDHLNPDQVIFGAVSSCQTWLLALDLLHKVLIRGIDLTGQKAADAAKCSQKKRSAANGFLCDWCWTSSKAANVWICLDTVEFVFNCSVIQIAIANTPSGLETTVQLVGAAEALLPWQQSLSFLPMEKSVKGFNAGDMLGDTLPSDSYWTWVFWCFSRMRSEGSRFTWGSGGGAVFAKSCVCDRNRSQPFATACGSAVRLSTVASVSGVVPKACQVESWRRSSIGVCRGGVCESDLWRRSYIGVCRGGVCASDLCRRSYIGVCRGGVCESDLWRRSYIGVCRGGVCESDLCRRRYIGVCRGGVCESDLCRRRYIGVCRECVCVSDLCRRSYIGVCRGGVCGSDLWRRRYIGVCRGGVCESDLCRRRYIGVCRECVCVSDLCRRSYIGVCRGGVCESDLWRRRYIGVCRGGVCGSDLCPRRGSSKSVIQECHVRSVKYECLTRVSSKKCPSRSVK